MSGRRLSQVRPVFYLQRSKARKETNEMPSLVVAATVNISGRLMRWLFHEKQGLANKPLAHTPLPSARHHYHPSPLMYGLQRCAFSGTFVHDECWQASNRPRPCHLHCKKLACPKAGTGSQGLQKPQRAQLVMAQQRNSAVWREAGLSFCNRKRPQLGLGNQAQVYDWLGIGRMNTAHCGLATWWKSLVYNE